MERTVSLSKLHNLTSEAFSALAATSKLAANEPSVVCLRTVLQMPYTFVRIEDLVTSDKDTRLQTITKVQKFLGFEQPAFPMPQLMVRP
jgi:hypothetical protein